MILTETVQIKIVARNAKYWQSRGYSFGAVGGRANANGTKNLEVSVKDLLPKSNVIVLCRCNDCQEEYSQRFSRDKEVCYKCRKSAMMKDNKLGAGKGRKIPSIQGSLHPRWNPNKDAQSDYYTKVRKYTEQTYVENQSFINPNNLPRTLCGVPGGYQLDHKVSVKKGFMFGINPKVLGSVDNLQMLPWEENRQKWS